VIDDDDAVRRSIVRMLGAHGHDAIGAVDGQEALRLALARVPNAIIMDVHMPEQNGIDVARMLRTHSVLANVPVISLSATPDHVAAEAELFHQVLSKPCSSSELLAAVLSAAQSRI
jgi:two-component system KDP operon response regulator KdpE